MTRPLPEPDSADPLDRLAPNARFDIGPAQYPEVEFAPDVPIRMRDGVVLFADITRPADGLGPVAEPLPAVINFTPYNKLFNRAAPYAKARAFGRRIGPSDRRRFTGRDVLHTPAGGMLEATATSPVLVSRGYVYLMVDVRGTGTSTGKWDFFSPTEQQDYLEVLRWVREQPWCNGDLALTGISYSALAALIAAGLRPDGLKAVFAIEAGENPVRELGLTGGVLSPFLGIWLAAVNVLKWVPSVRGLLRTRTLGAYLRDRVTDPASWALRAAGIALTAHHPDSFLNDSWAQKLARLEQITVPTWIHGAWHDVYNRSNFRMYDRIPLVPGVKQVLVDESYHSTPGSGFGAADAPQDLSELQCAWFDRWVKGIDNGIDRYGPVTLRQHGDGWVSRPQFPDPATTVRRLYLTADVSGSAAHADTDAVLAAQPPDFEMRLPLPTRRGSMASNNTAVISTGLATLFGKHFGSDDRRAEATAITFSTDPLPADLLLSGPLNLHLRVEAEGTDAFWSVTVTDVEPDGASAPLTRGALLSSLRAVDEAASSYVDGELIVAEHPFTAESVLPVQPGVPHDIDIDINVTEALLRAGHRLRVAVRRTSFPRHLLSLPQRRSVKGQTLILDPAHPSYLTFTAV